MISAFFRAFAEFSNKSFRKIALIGFTGSLLVLVLIWFIVWLALLPAELFLIGSFFGIFDWLINKLSGFFSGFFVTVIVWILFPSTVTLILSFFLEQVIDTVEEKHYPNLPAPRRQKVLKTLLSATRFSAISIGLNICVIPFYIAFFFLGPLNLLIFYVLNGYLLGKEYFGLITNQRLSAQDEIYLYKVFKGRVFLAGTIITFLMTIPLINLVAPVIATAAMVHLVQEWCNKLETINGE
jgi:CysZ protein